MAFPYFRDPCRFIQHRGTLRRRSDTSFIIEKRLYWRMVISYCCLGNKRQFKRDLCKLIQCIAPQWSDQFLSQHDMGLHILTTYRVLIKHGNRNFTNHHFDDFPSPSTRQFWGISRPYVKFPEDFSTFSRQTPVGGCGRENGDRPLKCTWFSYTEITQDYPSINFIANVA